MTIWLSSSGKDTLRLMYVFFEFERRHDGPTGTLDRDSSSKLLGKDLDFHSVIITVVVVVAVGWSVGRSVRSFTVSYGRYSNGSTYLSHATCVPPSIASRSRLFRKYKDFRLLPSSSMRLLTSFIYTGARIAAVDRARALVGPSVGQQHWGRGILGVNKQ